MIFRQFFEELSRANTYLIGCEETAQSLLIEPVYNTTECDSPSNTQELQLRKIRNVVFFQMTESPQG